MSLELKFLEYLKATKTEGTAINYVSQVRQVLRSENLTFEDLVTNINKIVPMYLKGGIKEREGRISHNSRRNALKVFKAFADEKVNSK